MRTSTPTYEDRDLRNLCRIAIIVRVVCVGAALAIMGFLTAMGLDFDGMVPVVALLLIVFPLSALWWALFKRGYDIRGLVYGQLLADLAVEGGVVYFSGGLSGHMMVVFLVTIFGAGILLSMRGALIAATVLTALLVLASAARQADIGQSIRMSADGRATTFFILNIAFQAIFFYLIAILGGFVSRRVRTVGVELTTKAEELQRARMDTSQIIESMNSGLVTVNVDGVITEVNQAASSILGVIPDEVRGKSVDEVLGEIAPDMLGRMREALKEGNEQRRAEAQVVNAGRSIPLGVSVSPMSDSRGRPTGAVCVFQDLTEVKNMEEKVRLADRMAALGELSAGIAHEIKTPLASICGSVEMLREALPGVGEDRKLVDLVIKESERLRDIIDHFLQFARSRPAQFKQVSLGSVLDEVVCMVGNHPDFTEGVAVDLDVGGEVTIVADEENVRQVFYNLAANAVEAVGPSGRLEIKVDPDVVKDSKRFARIVFKDDGEGMDEEAQAQAFRPFYTGKKSGTGLGLAIVSKIVEEHGGSIEMESARGKGTMVSVYLPCEIDNDRASLCGALPESGQTENSES